ncbi:integrase catalytic domain-containing protein [Trichonephila clavipes]|uniref:Integrase catalytic domain-containing protein n=1 Tax=Trichonephila clavipes TaxID=2585209 RepID=A0A8X6WBM3_TRICX|nr:integrase catalytic domain-containing protein [Trichonephila clavipes]
MLYSLKSKYFIRTSVVLDFLELCTVYQKKKAFPRERIIVCPIVSRDFNHRGQVDLVELQPTPDRNYKWLLHYQDHTMKFSFLRLSTSKRATEVALEQLKMFLEVVQFQKNSSFHRTIKRSPYKVLFGSEPKIGFQSSHISKGLLELITEEDLDLFLNQQDHNMTSTPEDLLVTSLKNKNDASKYLVSPELLGYIASTSKDLSAHEFINGNASTSKDLLAPELIDYNASASKNQLVPEFTNLLQFLMIYQW